MISAFSASAVVQTAKVMVSAGASEADHEVAARADARVAAALDGQTVRKVVVVPGRIVNFVVG